MKVLIAGDFCSRFRTTSVIERGDYEKSLGCVKTITTQCDYSIVNLECPVVKGDLTPITKQGPNLYGTTKMIDAIKFMGFNCVTLANNHFYDQGEQGVQDTLESLNSECIDYVGAGVSLEKASEILYKNIDGERLAVINCCEHEFSIATEGKGGANPLNPIHQYNAIKSARAQADYVLVIVHGGYEHYQLPSPRMVETYRFFIESGADAVVNHHQHCYSGFEIYNKKPIFYGLGNLFFDTEPLSVDSKWNYGYCVLLEFTKPGVNHSEIPYTQCAEKALIELLPMGSFDKHLKILNSIISNPSKLTEATNEYLKKCMSEVEYFFNPYQNRLLRGLVRFGIIPSPFIKKWLLKLENYILCESHREKVEYYLKHK